MSATGDSAPACSWEPAPQRPRLQGEEVHVWRTALARSPAEVEALKRLLSEDELRRAERFHFEHDRSSFVVARGTLREILSLYVGLPPQLLRLGHNAYGKPELAGAPGEAGLRFNLSHSGGLALYAVAAVREVGVDVEAVREGISCGELAERFFSHREVAALLALPACDRTRAFFEARRHTSRQRARGSRCRSTASTSHLRRGSRRRCWRRATTGRGRHAGRCVS